MHAINERILVPINLQIIDVSRSRRMLSSVVLFALMTVFCRARSLMILSQSASPYQATSGIPSDGGSLLTVGFTLSDRNNPLKLRKST